jgi:hypothetical protein
MVYAVMECHFPCGHMVIDLYGFTTEMAGHLHHPEVWWHVLFWNWVAFDPVMSSDSQLIVV